MVVDGWGSAGGFGASPFPLEAVAEFAGTPLLNEIEKSVLPLDGLERAGQCGTEAPNCEDCERQRSWEVQLLGALQHRVKVKGLF